MLQHPLAVRPSVYKRGGVIGRKDYLKNMAIIFALALLAVVAFGGVITTPNSASFLGLLAFVCFAGLAYLGYINAFKRLRDIRGTTENQLPYQLLLVVLFSIPYVSIIPLAILLLLEGAVTGNNQRFARSYPAPRDNVIEAKYRDIDPGPRRHDSGRRAA